MHAIELNKYNWEEIQNYYNQCCNKTMVMQKFNLSRHCLCLARKANLFKCLVIKHSWQRKDKKYSQPCEIFKKFLIQNEIHFYQQYSDRQTWKHNYSIDIAFPNQKIGIQINGNMHYTNDGQLKPYYKQRQNLLQSFGWKIYQIPYLEVWNEQLRQKILNMIKKNINFEYDYTQQIKQNMQKKRLQHICSFCGGYKKTRESKYCDWCNKHHKCPIQKSNVVKKILGKKLQKLADRYDIQKILKHELQKLVKQYSLEQVGRMHGISGNSIKNICIKCGINYKQYSHSIRSRIVKNVMKQKYKNYQNPKGVCPICNGKKNYLSIICKKCYLKNRKLVDKIKSNTI